MFYSINGDYPEPINPCELTIDFEDTPFRLFAIKKVEEAYNNSEINSRHWPISFSLFDDSGVEIKRFRVFKKEKVEFDAFSEEM